MWVGKVIKMSTVREVCDASKVSKVSKVSKAKECSGRLRQAEAG